MLPTDEHAIGDRLISGFCPYCGCACNLLYSVSDNNHSIEKTLPDNSDPVSQGKPCVKGLMSHEVLNNNRLTTPMMRSNKTDKLQPCTWQEAYTKIKENLPNNADKLYFVGSGEVTNETNYLLSKLCRSHFKSNNIDSCARLCHAATGVGFERIFGIKAIPRYSMDDLASADIFFFIGTDPFEDYPALANRIISARNNGAKIITVDLASNTTVSQADEKFKITPGGILPLLATLVVRLHDKRDVSRDARQFSGYDDFIESCRKVSQENMPENFGFSHEDLDKLYWHLSEAKRLVIGFGMGLTQHVNGTQNVLAITGLSLLLDAILFPNRGKVNVQGASDVGAEYSWQMDSDMDGIELKSVWNMDFSEHKGKQLTDALYSDDTEFLWIIGSDPAISMPDLNKLYASFEKKFIVYQSGHPGKTMDFADVVLPSSVLPEELGCVTSGERRVRGIFGGKWMKSEMTKKEAKGNAQIINEFADLLGAKGFGFEKPEDIFEEMVKVVPGYNKLTIEAVSQRAGAFADKTPKTTILQGITYDSSHFKGDGSYPFILTTARNRFQFCSGSISRNSPSLVKLSGEYSVLINPLDAEALKIDTGSKVKLVSPAGELEVEVKIDESIEKRILVAQFHFDKLLVNKLTPLALDPESGTPCYKEVAVKIEPIV